MSETSVNVIVNGQIGSVINKYLSYKEVAKNAGSHSFIVKYRAKNIHGDLERFRTLTPGDEVALEEGMMIEVAIGSHRILAGVEKDEDE